MRITAACLTALLVLALSIPAAVAAPLFPDVPENHWARDAVAALAAKGLVEGYPDGTFKGDRACSRYEVAMVVARLLAKMEAEHATFATKADLDQVQALAAALKEELEALGVRVTALEGQAENLGRRVDELERITFYGTVSARVVGQQFRNTGSPAMGGAPPLVDYNAAVGSATGAGGFVPAPSAAAGLQLDPRVFGVQPVGDLLTGRPLTTGTGLTARTVLGIRVLVAEDFQVGLELAAFTSQGDALVDAFQGLSAPYLSNPFTGSTSVTGGLAGLQSANHAPWTRLTLDRLWLDYQPAKLKLTLGAFGRTTFKPMMLTGEPVAQRNTGFDPLVYEPQPDPGRDGWHSYEPQGDLSSFGLQARGEFPLVEDESTTLSWEIVGTRLADGSLGVPAGLGGLAAPGAVGGGYFSHAEGASLGFDFDDDRCSLRVNFLHAANDASGGAPLAVGLILTPNLTLNWVNPAGYFVNQLGGPGDPRVGGIGTTGDVRPVPGTNLFLDGATGIAGTPNFGGLGPQDQTMAGASVRYYWDALEWKPFLLADYGWSSYRPQKNSSYSATGNAFRVGAGLKILQAVNLEAAWLQVDPDYDPFLLQYPQVGGIQDAWRRLPDFHQYPSLYSLHDTHLFPHNRKGIWAGGDVMFPMFGGKGLGRAQVHFGTYSQTRTSLQDVRYSPGSLGAGVPNSPVLGYSPGYLDPVFTPFAPQTFASDGSNGFALPLENPRGSTTYLEMVLQQWFALDEKWDRKVKVDASVRYSNFYRNSELRSILGNLGGPERAGESMNFIDLDYLGLSLGAAWDVAPDVTVSGRYTRVEFSGHHDPLGAYGGYAVATGQTRFDTVDSTQQIPEIALDWRLAEQSSVNLTARYFLNADHISSGVWTTPSAPALNLGFGPQGGAHPFNWEGWQVVGTYELEF